MFNGVDGFCVNGGGWVFVFMVVAGFCFGFHSYCFVLSWDFSAFFMIFMFATEYCGSSFYEGEATVKCEGGTEKGRWGDKNK